MAQENFGKRFDGYQIYDRHYEKVGKVDDLSWTRTTSPSTSASRPASSAAVYPNPHGHRAGERPAPARRGRFRQRHHRSGPQLGDDAEITPS